MSDHREDRIGQLCEDLEKALAADESLDLQQLAKRFDVEPADVERAVAALQMMQGALDEDQLTSDVDLTPPHLPDDYELLGELGRGGMGIVYHAHQKSLDRDLAVKVLRPGDLMFGEAVQRFEREAKSLARLRHRHIVSVHEVGNADGFVYFTMDLIDGRTLAARLQEAPMTSAQTVRLMLQVTSAIAYAHGKSVMHRDLKPANILIDQDEDAFVVDFGLARDLGGAAGATLTGQMLGTPAYMSPEQALGDSERIGEASDVYALGAVLYECLTGRAPFEGLPLAQLMHAVIEHEPGAVRQLNPRVPPDLQVICEKAMQKNPAERYATVQALAEDLERFSIGQPILARPRTAWSHGVKFVRRHQRAIAGAGVPALLLLACAWWLVMPAVMRGRTLALAERMHAVGSSQGAAAAYGDVYRGVDPEQLPLAERVRYLRSLIDEAGRLYVLGTDADAASAAEFVVEAQRVLGFSPGRDYWQQFALEGEQLLDDWRVEYLRLEPFVGASMRRYNFIVEPLLLRIGVRDQVVGREADMLRAFWSTEWIQHSGNGWSEQQREAILTLLPIAHRFPECVQNRLRWISRVVTITTPYDYIDEQFLARLVAIAGDRSLPVARRQDAACLFDKCGWMPFLTKMEAVEDDFGTRTEAVAEQVDLEWLQQAWSQLAGWNRQDKYRRRVELCVARLATVADEPRVGKQAPDWWRLRDWVKDHAGWPGQQRAPLKAWWQENRSEDPRSLLLRSLRWRLPVAQLTVKSAFERLRDSDGTGRAHNLLALCVDDGVPIPFFGTYSRPQLQWRWQRSLKFDPPAAQLLRVAIFAMVDGEVEPRLIRSHQEALHDGVTVNWAFPVNDELPFLDARVGMAPWRQFKRRPLQVVGKAILRYKGRAPRVDVQSWVDGTWPVDLAQQLVYDGDLDVDAGHIGFLGGIGWRVRDGQARFDCFTVATFRPQAEGDQVWTREDWRKAIAETLDHIGSGEQNPAINNAKHMALATFFAMPGKLAQIKRFDKAFQKGHAADYCMFIRKACLLLAGDEDAVDYDTSPSSGHSGEFLDVNFFVRLAVLTSSKKIRDYAFDELHKLPLDAGLLRTIAKNEALAPHLPEWLAAQAASAPSRLSVWLADSVWRILGLLAHMTLVVVALCRLRRGAIARRTAALFLLMPAGLALPLWGVWFDAQEWNPRLLGHALHVFGVWVYCWRFGDGPSWQIVALMWSGTTVAYVSGNLDQPAVAWIISVVSLLVLRMRNESAALKARQRCADGAPDRATAPT